MTNENIIHPFQLGYIRVTNTWWILWKYFRIHFNSFFPSWFSQLLFLFHFWMEVDIETNKIHLTSILNSRHYTSPGKCHTFILSHSYPLPNEYVFQHFVTKVILSVDRVLYSKKWKILYSKCNNHLISYSFRTYE